MNIEPHDQRSNNDVTLKFGAPEEELNLKQSQVSGSHSNYSSQNDDDDSYDNVVKRVDDDGMSLAASREGSIIGGSANNSRAFGLIGKIGGDLQQAYLKKRGTIIEREGGFDEDSEEFENEDMMRVEEKEEKDEKEDKEEIEIKEEGKA